MIVMFVSYEDSVEVIDVFFDGCQPRQRLALPKSSVNKESGALGLEQRNVPRAARRQNGNPQPDRCPQTHQSENRIVSFPQSNCLRIAGHVAAAFRGRPRKQSETIFRSSQTVPVAPVALETGLRKLHHAPVAQPSLAAAPR